MVRSLVTTGGWWFVWRGRRYTVCAYKGKQVRDNIHAEDLVEAFWQFFLEPRACDSSPSQ